MPDFSVRSYEKELLDRTDIPFADIKRNMQELEFINTQLGGHKITISGIKNIFRKTGKGWLTVCEIGCGGGDNLKAIDKWCKRNNVQVKLVGIDINRDCIDYARQNCNMISDIQFIVSDYSLVQFDNEKPDIIFSSLFCHHLTDDQFIQMLQWSKQYSTIGFFINDLHRHPIAYYSIKLLSKVFSKSYLVKNDAPLSVRRGFKKDEIEKLLNKCGIRNFNIQWKWAFRWLVTIKNE